jgi:hypothetical protein
MTATSTFFVNKIIFWKKVCEAKICTLYALCVLFGEAENVPLCLGMIINAYV